MLPKKTVAFVRGKEYGSVEDALLSFEDKFEDFLKNLGYNEDKGTNGGVCWIIAKIVFKEQKIREKDSSPILLVWLDYDKGVTKVYGEIGKVSWRGNAYKKVLFKYPNGKRKIVPFTDEDRDYLYKLDIINATYSASPTSKIKYLIKLAERDVHSNKPIKRNVGKGWHKHSYEHRKAAKLGRIRKKYKKWKEE